MCAHPWRAALAAVLAAAVLAACGGGNGSNGDRITASAVVKTTENAGTVRVSTRISLSMDRVGPPPSHFMSSTSEGVYDFVNHRGQMTSRIDGGSQTFTEELRWIGTRQYMRLSGTGGPPMPKPWVAFPTDPRQPAGGAASFTGLLGAQGEPSQLLDQLRRASTRVDVVGHDRVRGTETTHERFAIDPTKLTSTTDAGEDPALSDAPTSADAWIDGDGRLRRLRMGGVASVDMELWDYGAAVHVDPPPSGQVLDATTEDGIAAGMEALSGLIGSGPTGPDVAGPKLTGPWKAMTSGAWRDVRWTVWQAPAANEVCTAFEVSPPPGRALQLPAGVADTLPAHDGVLAECSDPTLVEDDPMPMLSLGMADVATPKYRVVAGFAPAGATRITVGTKEGALTPVPIDASSRVFVWFGELAQIPATLDVAGRDALHCTLDAEGASADFSQCNPTKG